MQLRFLHYCSFLIAGACLSFPVGTMAGHDPQAAPNATTALNILEGGYLSTTVDIYVKGANGAALERPAMVTLTRLDGQAYDQGPTRGGFIRFDHVPASELTAKIIAPGYETVTKRFEITNRLNVVLNIELQPLSDKEEADSAVRFYALSPKLQKNVGKALEALRANKPNDALGPLESALKNSPNNAEVEYLLGVYSEQMKKDGDARLYWMKTLELSPKHLSALLSLSQSLLGEHQAPEAVPYLNRALEVQPASWRAHAMLAEALVMQDQNEPAVKEARRAMELGHERAASIQYVLARALLAQGGRDEAIVALEAYLKSHPSDTDAAKDLADLKNPATTAITLGPAHGLTAVVEDAVPMASNWRPPDIDEKVPSVETGASCLLDNVVNKAGEQLMTLIADVDRFSATESLLHESINKYGLPSASEKRKFNYVVSIQDLHHKYLNVEEYRNEGGSPAEFPDGVATNGLPALVLIFHPYNAPNFEMTCEGLARMSSGLAWQVHFRQRPDKPNLVRRYRVGADGPSYPVAMKGRAWISAESYQIVRLETDLVEPLPKIRLAADHAEIEYGPVQFKNGKVNMWLPQSAEIYYDWKGHRIHRRHSFSHYLLFAVEDRQKISVPKVDDSTDGAAPDTSKQKP